MSFHKHEHTNYKINKMSEKKLYWLLESNYDLSITVTDLTQVQIEIQRDFDSLNDDEKEDHQYTIDPMYLTDEEYKDLQEA